MTSDDRLIVALDVPNMLDGLKIADRICDSAPFNTIRIGQIIGTGLAPANQLQNRPKLIFLATKHLHI